jgi:hypothetical protein
LDIFRRATSSAELRSLRRRSGVALGPRGRARARSDRSPVRGPGHAALADLPDGLLLVEGGTPEQHRLQRQVLERGSPARLIGRERRMRNCGASARTWCSASCRFFPVADTPRQSRPSHCRCCSRKYRARSGQPDVARGVAAARGRWATPEVWAPPRSEGGIGSSSGSTMNTRPVGLPTSGSAGTSSGGKAKEKNPLVDQGQPLPDRGTAGACSPTRGDRERQRARRPEALPGRAAGPRNLGLRVRGATPAPRQLPRLPRPPAVAARRGVWCSAIRSRPELLLWKTSSATAV